MKGREGLRIIDPAFHLFIQGTRTESQRHARSGERLNSDTILALSGHCKQS